MRPRRLIRTLIGLVSVAAAVLGIYYWQQTHVWPFSWGSKDEAFLGTTFGMSRQEAERALKKHGARLESYFQYKNDSAGQLLIEQLDLKVFSMSDERDFYYLYMPSIEMFDSTAQGEFEFYESRLRYVTIYFDPNYFHSFESLVSALTEALQKRYEVGKRKDSKDTPGAYWLDFTARNVVATLWVNPTNPKKPILSLHFHRTTDQSGRRQRIQQREDSAFGRP